MERYARNIGTLTPEENELLRTKRAAIVGCGGLGGYILEMLGRLGVGHLTVIDGDVFAPSNLNRQLLSDTGNIGSSKVLAAAERMKLVNPDIAVTPVAAVLDEDNALALLRNHDVVMDALDNIPSRLAIARACAALQIPLVHGAIHAWYGQVATILPGDDTMERIYQSPEFQKNLRPSNPSFTPALVAALQVAEAVKLLTGRGTLLSGGTLLLVDALHNEYRLTKLK